MINSIKKHYLLGIALILAILTFGLMAAPYVTFAGSVKTATGDIVASGSVNGFSLAFGVNFWIHLVVEGTKTKIYQEIGMSIGFFITFFAIILGFLLSLYVTLKDKHPYLAFGTAGLFLLSAILMFAAVPVSGISFASEEALEEAAKDSSITINPKILKYLGESIEMKGKLGIGSILGGILMLVSIALIFVDFFYKPADVPTAVKYKQELVDNDILVSVRHLKQFFPMGGGNKLKAVHDVSFDIKKGECFGIVGESGCGKTTTGRTLIRLYDATSGSVYFKGYRVNAGSRWNEKEIKWTKIRAKNQIKELREQEKAEIDDMDSATLEGKEAIAKVHERYNAQIAEIKKGVKTVVKEQEKKIAQIQFDNNHVDPKLISKMQMIFQDPIDSLDPRMTVEEIIAEGLKIQGYRNQAENHEKVCKVLEEVGLIPDYCSRYPNEFSGGQRQRIGIARAIVMNPEFMICDEPISALDVSIRAQIINLLNNLKENHGLTLMFIAHDLSVVKYFCDRIAVMYFGEVVEMAPSDELFAHPLHPYTRALLSAIPKPDPISEKKRQRIVYVPSKEHDYSVEKPKLQEILPGHFVLANTPEMDKYREMIKADDAAIAKKAAEEAKNSESQD